MVSLIQFLSAQKFERLNRSIAAGHFDVYCGQSHFNKTLKSQLDFLQRIVPVGSISPASEVINLVDV